jgi:cytochrome oxidase Cu insertion factor (SCO1/SenC/PrrC family)
MPITAHGIDGPARRPRAVLWSLLALATCSVGAADDPPPTGPVAPIAAPASSPALRAERARSYFGDHLLTDQDGRARRFYSDLLDGRVVLINVVFTHCPSACPMMTERLKLVRRQLGPAFGKDVYFLSLSVDPARDSPGALKRFAQRHGADETGWRFLVADEAVMKVVLGRLGQWSDSPEDHTTLLIAGNAAKSHWVKLRPDASPERIVADLERLK